MVKIDRNPIPPPSLAIELTDLRCYRSLRDTKRLERSLGTLVAEIILSRLTRALMEPITL